MNAPQSRSRAVWVGTSASARRLEVEARHAAACSAPVIITGETGVGKNLLARLIHDCSVRRLGPYVVINCATVAERVLEAQLFGTPSDSPVRDATHGEAASSAAGGTIVLDAVGEANSRTHAIVLRFLDVEPLDAVRAVRLRSPARIIATANRPLSGSMAQGTFSYAVYAHLNGLSFAIPPLRERREDIDPLLHHFLAMFGERDHAPVPALSSSALSRLQTYDWPGNVHELKNMAERLIVGRFTTIDSGVLEGVLGPAAKVLQT